jgi:hypothetical protein
MYDPIRSTMSVASRTRSLRSSWSDDPAAVDDETGEAATRALQKSVCNQETVGM